MGNTPARSSEPSSTLTSSGEVFPDVLPGSPALSHGCWQPSLPPSPQVIQGQEPSCPIQLSLQSTRCLVGPDSITTFLPQPGSMEQWHGPTGKVQKEERKLGQHAREVPGERPGVQDVHFSMF